ncbi:uncharacterized protein [Parasteatoda tepidariorum]|nr:uncharacterized protein LOC107444732 [Parasteatoda tepidariorum]
MRCITMLAIAFTLLISYSLAEQVPFQECKSGNNVLGVIIHPCHAVEHEGWTTCVFEHGTSVKVEAAILAPFDASQLETVASATINDHMVPFMNSGNNACIENVVPSCPIHEGHFYIFNFRFEVMKYYPTGYMEIGFAVKDPKSKENVACVKLPVIVQKNPKLSYNN